MDISPLAKVGDGIHVRDVSLGDKVRIMDDPDDMIVNATYAKIEVEEVAVAAEGAVAVAASAPIRCGRDGAPPSSASQHH